MPQYHVHLGADHRGFSLKEQLKKYLEEQHYSVVDHGTTSEAPVDYPLIAKPVAEAVVANDNENRGILICGTGEGVCMAANRIHGCRAGEAWNEEIAGRIRLEDDTNVLCLAADYQTFDQASKIAVKWLETPFSGEERHKRRIAEVDALEK